MSGPRWPDIDPGDLDESGEPYPGYSSPSIHTSFHDHEMGRDRDEDPVALLVDEIDDELAPGQRGPCPGHVWVYSGTAYGGDDESFHGEGRCYCEICGADGDA